LLRQFIGGTTSVAPMGDESYGKQAPQKIDFADLFHQCSTKTLVKDGS
jgi:hypothetical protein